MKDKIDKQVDDDRKKHQYVKNYQMKPYFYDTCSHFIICNQCGFQTKSAEDMIKHLAQVQKYEEDNCTKKIIILED